MDQPDTPLYTDKLQCEVTGLVKPLLPYEVAGVVKPLLCNLHTQLDHLLLEVLHSLPQLFFGGRFRYRLCHLTSPRIFLVPFCQPRTWRVFFGSAMYKMRIAALTLSKRLFVEDIMRSFGFREEEAERQYMLDFPRMSVLVEGEECCSESDVPRYMWHLCTQATLALPLILASALLPHTLVDTPSKVNVDIWNESVLVSKIMSARHPETLDHIHFLRIHVRICDDVRLEFEVR